MSDSSESFTEEEENKIIQKIAKDRMKEIKRKKGGENARTWTDDQKKKKKERDRAYYEKKKKEKGGEIFESKKQRYEKQGDRQRGKKRGPYRKRTEKLDKSPRKIRSHDMAARAAGNTDPITGKRMKSEYIKKKPEDLKTKGKKRDKDVRTDSARKRKSARNAMNAKTAEELDKLFKKDQVIGRKVVGGEIEKMNYITKKLKAQQLNHPLPLARQLGKRTSSYIPKSIAHLQASAPTIDAKGNRYVLRENIFKKTFNADSFKQRVLSNYYNYLHMTALLNRHIFNKIRSGHLNTLGGKDFREYLGIYNFIDPKSGVSAYLNLFDEMMIFSENIQDFIEEYGRHLRDSKKEILSLNIMGGFSEEEDRKIDQVQKTFFTKNVLYKEKKGNETDKPKGVHVPNWGPAPKISSEDTALKEDEYYSTTNIIYNIFYKYIYPEMETKDLISNKGHLPKEGQEPKSLYSSMFDNMYETHVKNKDGDSSYNFVQIYIDIMKILAIYKYQYPKLKPALSEKNVKFQCSEILNSLLNKTKAINGFYQIRISYSPRDDEECYVKGEKKKQYCDPTDRRRKVSPVDIDYYISNHTTFQQIFLMCSYIFGQKMGTFNLVVTDKENNSKKQNIPILTYDDLEYGLGSQAKIQTFLKKNYDTSVDEIALKVVLIAKRMRQHDKAEAVFDQYLNSDQGINFFSMPRPEILKLIDYISPENENKLPLPDPNDPSEIPDAVFAQKEDFKKLLDRRDENIRNNKSITYVTKKINEYKMENAPGKIKKKPKTVALNMSEVLPKVLIGPKKEQERKALVHAMKLYLPPDETWLCDYCSKTQYVLSSMKIKACCPDCFKTDTGVKHHHDHCLLNKQRIIRSERRPTPRKSSKKSPGSKKTSPKDPKKPSPKGPKKTSPKASKGSTQQGSGGQPDRQVRGNIHALNVSVKSAKASGAKQAQLEGIAQDSKARLDDENDKNFNVLDPNQTDNEVIDNAHKTNDVNEMLDWDWGDFGESAEYIPDDPADYLPEEQPDGPAPVGVLKAPPPGARAIP